MKSKQILCFLILLFTLSALISCRIQTKDLKTAGAEVAALMSEMTQQEGYAALYRLPAAYSETLTEVQNGNHQKMQAVYQLTFSPEKILGTGMDDSSFSPAIADYITASAYVSFSSVGNQNESLDAMAVSAAFSASKTFVGETLTEPVIYLYTFTDGFPIAVTFIPGDDGAIRAVGSFIINRKLVTDSAETIEACFKDIGIPDVHVTKK